MRGMALDVNDAFHAQYDHTRDDVEDVVFVVLGDDLVICEGKKHTKLAIRPPAFHASKALAHGPLAAFLALRSNDEARVRKVRDALANSGSTDALCTIPLAALEKKLIGESVDAEAMARATTPHLLRATEEATRLHLETLHAKVEEAVAGLVLEQQQAFVVVVTGDHQARDRSVAMQYFRKRLREPAGEERRVIYAEAVTDVKGALALVDTNRVDRALAKAFFDDEKRLQRDVLGDAAKKLLDAMET